MKAERRQIPQKLAARLKFVSLHTTQDHTISITGMLDLQRVKFGDSKT